MKATDLRLGNWVQHEPYSDEKFMVDFSLLHSIDLELIECVGIPLTPEILVKAGFKENFNFFNIRHLEYTLISNRMRYKTKVIDKPLKYVHQLQNLYFALTGEELNIEL